MTETTDKPKKSKRRGKGEGSIFQRKDKRWASTITVGYDATGKRLRRTIYGATKREVTTELTRLQNDKLDGTLRPATKMPLAALLDRWLSSWVDDLAAGSIRNYKRIGELYLKPTLGGMPIDKLQPVHIRELLDRLAKDGIGARTRQYAYVTIRRALQLALKLELIQRNPCEAVDSPRVSSREVEPLTVEQAEELLNHVQGGRWEALFTLALSTGLRQGELFALAWADIDLDRGVLSVRHSLECVGAKLTIKEPKSASGKRVVRLDAADVEVLREHRKRLADEGLAFGEWVFPNTEGGLICKNNFQRRVWFPIRKALGIETVRFHDLRHSNASFLLRAGTHPKIVQARLGHATIKLTMDRYSHLLPDAQDDAAGAFHRSRPKQNSANGCQLAVKDAAAEEIGQAESA